MSIIYSSSWDSFSFFFFNDTATTEIYTLSLHDALPIYAQRRGHQCRAGRQVLADRGRLRLCADAPAHPGPGQRSEEHTSELQSQSNLVCRLLLEKKKPACGSLPCFAPDLILL